MAMLSYFLFVRLMSAFVRSFVAHPFSHFFSTSEAAVHENGFSPSLLPKGIFRFL